MRTRNNYKRIKKTISFFYQYKIVIVITAATTGSNAICNNTFEQWAVIHQR